MSENEELPSLDELGKKIEKAKQESVEANKEPEVSRGGMQLTIELVSGVLAGLLIGVYIDKWFHSAPWFTIICFLLGFAGSVRNIIRPRK